MANSRLGVTSPTQEHQILNESDLLKILSESMNFSRHSKAKSVNNMNGIFYNNTADGESVFTGDDAMSVFSGI
jgi:hypothetical protein